MEQSFKARYNFPIKVASIVSILTILMIIAIGYIFMYYLGSLDIVDDSTVKANINNTTALWTTVAGVLGFVIVIIVLFYIFKALPKTK